MAARAPSVAPTIIAVRVVFDWGTEEVEDAVVPPSAVPGFGPAENGGKGEGEGTCS